MRHLLALTLAASLLLTGCGQGAPGAAQARRLAAQAQARAQASENPARDFAARMKGRYAGTVTLEGPRVTLRSPDQPASVYDFARTAATGQVQVTIGDFATALAFADLMADGPDEGGSEVLPALLVPIALDMAAAGGQALALYWLGHRGDDFDKGDAAKAVGLAMALAIVPFLGEMTALGHTLPVAAKLVASCDGFTAREVMRAAAAMSGELVDLAKFLIKLRKAQQGSAEAVPGIIL